MISRRTFLRIAGAGALSLAVTPLDMLISSCTNRRGNENQRALSAAADRLFSQLENNSVLLPGEQIVVPVLDAPLVGFASADNPLFETFKRDEVIGSQWRAPKEWMPEAKSVVVFFFPISSAIRARHRAAKTATNEAWNYGYECRTYAATLRTENDPGYCGKCLVGIPCEFVKP